MLDVIPRPIRFIHGHAVVSVDVESRLRRISLVRPDCPQDLAGPLVYVRVERARRFGSVKRSVLQIRVSRRDDIADTRTKRLLVCLCQSLTKVTIINPSAKLCRELVIPRKLYVFQLHTLFKRSEERRVGKEY